MRNNLGIGSIIKDTNKIISPSDWRGCRIGSFVKFQKDSNYYIVSRIEPLFYLTEFEKIDNRKIKINIDTGINLNISDTISLSYKEWEVQTITEIYNNGKGYKIGDILSLQGGKPYRNPSDNIKDIAKISVDNTDESGAILRFSLTNKGKYYEIPCNETFEGIISVNGGKGNNAQFKLQFKLCDNRTIIEREIEDVEFNGKETIITLNYNIPEEIKIGKINANKWEVFLSTPYVEGSRINEQYEITRDFSPYLSCPLMVKGSMSVDAIFNAAIIILERKIQEQDKKIQEIINLIKK